VYLFYYVLSLSVFKFSLPKRTFIVVLEGKNGRRGDLPLAGHPEGGEAGTVIL